MKKFSQLIILSLLLVIFIGVDSHAQVIHPRLQSILQSLGPQDEVSVIITLSEKADIQPFKDKPKSLRRAGIIKALKSKADLTQSPLKTFLESRRARKIKSLWLINGIGVTAPANIIQELESLPGIEEISLDSVINLPEVNLEAAALPEWNIETIRAPELWNLGFRGQGIVVANMDSGVDVNHPDLQGKYRGGANSWYDPNGEHDTPYDADGHGTGTMGVMVGGDAGEKAIGVAPGAQWIAVKIFNDAGEAFYSVIHQGFQWLLDPDDDPDTDDAPDIVSNSWGLNNVNNCSLEFQADIQALKAAGIAVVFAAGNSGSGSSTSISPANNPEAIAAGSLSQSLNIALTSSRGPSACSGDIYPEVVAPGVNIRTADLFGSYHSWSGTSFAAPHVAGAMTLLLSAIPTLTVSELELALKQSAFDLGNPGPDNNYGYGLIDVLAAYQLLLDPVPDIFVDPSSFEFGKTKEGLYSLPWVFNVTNEGTETLSIFDIVITGTHFSEFLKQNDGCSGLPLAPSQTCTLEIVFSPKSGGVKNANLFIPSNDPDAVENPLNIALSGTGIEQYRLDVNLESTINGTGRVITKSGKINCGVDCSELYSPEQMVTLQVLADPESKFGGWSVNGVPVPSATNPFMVSMGRDKTVTVTFIGPSLTLTSPNNGESWKAGTNKRIKWTFTGSPGPYVKIELLQGDTVKTIAKQAPRGSSGKGHFDWFISKKILDGSDYRIRVTSSTYTDVSETFFTIYRR
jgi:hypothetical protein